MCYEQTEGRTMLSEVSLSTIFFPTSFVSHSSCLLLPDDDVMRPGTTRGIVAAVVSFLRYLYRD